MSHSSCRYVEHERGNLFLQTRTNKQKVKHERGNQISKFKWIRTPASKFPLHSQMTKTLIRFQNTGLFLSLFSFITLFFLLCAL
ncbi:hypothetical protein HanPI659440_Chr02g0089311 [Helianthus annuus]|nr:hypothetical protein HanIR_Chr13g0668331 [Helianthus annuus]KAJ0806426.1 hypothetical protein HanPI659440_Chr02g0089311 [Helianthus annuus]